ncbi:MAG: ATP-binding protein [Candidatus Manganitrophaceae bacterium]
MRFLAWHRHLQTKVALFVVFVVVSILFISTDASRRIIENQGKELLREEYVQTVKELEAGIGTVQELRNTPLLEFELARLQKVQPEILSTEIFNRTPEGFHLVAQNGRKTPFPLNRPETEAIKRGEIIAQLKNEESSRHWEILVPVHLGFDETKEVFGLIRARISTAKFDRLIDRERQRIFFITFGAAAMILLFLILYLDRTIGQPIRILTEEMARVETGDLSGRIEIKSDDEIGALAAQFNRMISKIKEGTEKIRELNDSLQERVQKATAEVNRRYEELTRVNRRLSEMQLQLTHTERLAAAGQMAAALAHKIGTPLHSTLGHLQRLKKDTSPEKREERLKIIESQVERVAESIREMLEMVRKPIPPATFVEINPLLNSLLDLVMPGIALHGITVKTRFEETLPSLTGDAGELQEAFLNLLTNAIDAMPTGGTLFLETRSVDIPKRSIIVTISDTGCGISETDLPKIFEPFFTTKEKGKGTGLGLAICRNILHAHGGEIQVSSRPGKGAVFTITLPMKNE